MKQTKMNGWIMVLTIYIVLTAVYGISAVFVFTAAAVLGIVVAKISDRLSEGKSIDSASRDG